MENIKLTEDDIRKILLDMITTTTSIEDAINEKKKEDELLDKSFRICNKAYKIVTNDRIKMIISLDLSKLSLLCLKLISLLRRDGASEYIGYGIDKIDETKDIILKQKYLLRSIKDAMYKLQKYRVSECNYEIAVLLTLIIDKNEMLFEELDDYIKSCEQATNGIGFIRNRISHEEIAEIDEQIFDYVKTLGLK